MSACFGARLQLTKPLAVLGADVADIRAERADAGVKLTLVREKIGGRGADRRAVEHQADVLRPRVFAAEFEAVRHHRRQTGGMAARERFHARVHLSAEPVGNFRHGK